MTTVDVMARTGRSETKSAAWATMKRRVIERDGGICWVCGQPGADSADHVVPLAEGGRHHVDNLAAVHHNAGPKCNRLKAAGTVTNARAKLAATGAAVGDSRPRGPRWSRDWRTESFGGVDYSDRRNW